MLSKYIHEVYAVSPDDSELLVVLARRGWRMEDGRMGGWREREVGKMERMEGMRA